MTPRIGIFGLSGCWGEQIVMLNCEDELPALLGAVEIVDFLGGSSRNDTEGPLDVAFVEGSVGDPRDEATLRRVRERAKRLVACGSCACFGGIAALDCGKAARASDLRGHRPLRDFVTVDAALPGCPMEKHEFLAAAASLVHGDLPIVPDVPVCLACRMRENDCLLLSRGLPCLGSVTLGGCGARCPSLGVPCIACRGPVPEANTASLRRILKERGLPDDEIDRRMTLFSREERQ